MLVIGLTGGSGCGKNAVARLLLEKGIETLDTDLLYHEMTSVSCECVRELAAAFGTEVLNGDGSLCRSRLAEIVFAPDDGRDARMKLLGDVTHKYIRKETESWLSAQKENGAVAAVIDAPVLFESGFDALCDTTVAMLASRDTRLSRIQKRDGISREKAALRIDAQPSDLFYIHRADCVFHNDGDLATLAKEVERFLSTLEFNK